MEKPSKLRIGYTNILTLLSFVVILVPGSQAIIRIFYKVFELIVLPFLDILMTGKVNPNHVLSLDSFNVMGTLFVIAYGVAILKILYTLIFKFKIISITKNKLTVVYVFRFHKETILIDEIKSVEWKSWSVSPYSFISVKISDHKNIITISDFEIENFHTIVAEILGTNYTDNSIHYFKSQAKQNSFLSYLTVFASLILLFYTLPNIYSSNASNYSILIAVVGALTMGLSIKRIFEYRKAVNIYNSTYITK